MSPETNNRRHEVQLAGVGGQGLALAGIILAEAAGIYEGKNVAQTEVHGVNVRGGPSRSEIIISDDEIDFLGVNNPDILLAMTPKDCQRYAPSLKEGGALVVDSSVVQEVPAVRANIYRIPLTKMAREDMGNEMVVSVIALGVICSLTGVVSAEALEKAVLARVPAKARELNRTALEAGFQAGQKAKRELATQ